jgi:hypothetical protein
LARGGRFSHCVVPPRFRLQDSPNIEANGIADRRLSRAAAGYSIQEFARCVKVTSVAGGLLDHVQDYPAKIGDRLVWPVEGKLAQQSCVQVL